MKKTILLILKKEKVFCLKTKERRLETDLEFTKRVGEAFDILRVKMIESKLGEIDFNQDKKRAVFWLKGDEK